MPATTPHAVDFPVTRCVSDIKPAAGVAGDLPDHRAGLGGHAGRAPLVTLQDAGDLQRRPVLSQCCWHDAPVEQLHPYQGPAAKHAG